MIEYKQGSIFYQDVAALVNPVNCVGVMGAGLAKQFKGWFPNNFTAYWVACRDGKMVPGQMFVYRRVHQPYIINFPTKYHWRDKSNMADIESGMSALAETIEEYYIKSIAIPCLGCGLGGLAWADVRQCIRDHMDDLDDVRIVVLGAAT